MKDRTALLRNTLKANALFSFLCGVLLTLFYNRLGSYLGYSPLEMALATGISLVIFSLFVWFTARAGSINHTLVWIIIGMDIVWTLLTLYDVFTGSFTVAGSWIMGIISLLVADFALFQYIGLRRAVPSTETANA